MNRGKKNFYNCTYCGRRGQTADSFFQNPRSINYSKSFKRTDKNGSRNHKKTEKDDIEIQNGTATLITPSVVPNGNKTSRAFVNLNKNSAPSTKWHKDSTCTYHMTNDIKNFTCYRLDNVSFQVGNKEFIKTRGCGSVVTTAFIYGRREKVTFENLLYTPEIM